MELIDKAAVVAEIEKAIDETAPSHDQQCQYEDGYYCGLYKAESIIDTLEVKEVDLDEEIDSWVNDLHTAPTFEELDKFAKHFFELGINAKVADAYLEAVATEIIDNSQMKFEDEE